LLLMCQFYLLFLAFYHFIDTKRHTVFLRTLFHM
jgi:hypothetical protein